jgi:hypothetical protein
MLGKSKNKENIDLILAKHPHSNNPVNARATNCNSRVIHTDLVVGWTANFGIG